MDGWGLDFFCAVLFLKHLQLWECDSFHNVTLRNWSVCACLLIFPLWTINPAFMILHVTAQWHGSGALGPLAPPWCPMLPAEPAGPDECPAPASPRSGSTGTGSLVRTSRSELFMSQMRWETNRYIKAKRKSLASELISSPPLVWEM